MRYKLLIYVRLTFKILFFAISSSLSVRIRYEILGYNFTLSLPFHLTQSHDINAAVVHFFLRRFFSLPAPCRVVTSHVPNLREPVCFLSFSILWTIRPDITPTPRSKHRNNRLLPHLHECIIIPIKLQRIFKRTTSFDRKGKLNMSITEEIITVVV